MVGRGEKPEKQAARRELGGADERKKEKLPRRIQRRKKEIEFFESKLSR